MSSDLTRYAPTWLKTRWARLLGGVLAAVLLLALAAPYLLDVDRYRDRIADIISMQAGRKVTLGRLHATVLPRIGFSVDGFQMANPPGFAQGQFVLADQIHGALAFWPLVLRRELRVISLELVEPRLMLLEDDRGRNNYSFPARRVAPGARAQPVRTNQADGRSSSITLMVDEVTLRHAAIFYGTVDRRGRPAATVHISNLDAQLRQIALQPLRIREWQADASLGGSQLTLAGWNTPLLFDSGDVALRDGKLDSSFTLQFGKAARVEGSVTVPNVENAVPQFDLKTDDVDLTALLAGAAEPFPARGGNLQPTAFQERGRGRAPAPVNQDPPVRQPPRAPGAIPFSPPEAGPPHLVASGHIAAERVHQDGYQAGPLTADVRIYNDRTEIWPFTLRMAGGALQATARTDRLQVPQRFSVNIQMRELSTERILQDSPALKGKLAGTAELEMQLVGSVEPRWAESLTGNGQFAVRSGRIAGFNLTGAAQSIASLAGVNGDTPFTRIAGDFTIRDGRVHSRQIHMDSPRGTLDLKGSCGFYGSLDYQGQMIAQLGGPAAGNGARDILSNVIGSAAAHNAGPLQITVPFLLQGTWQQPQLRPGRAAPKFSRTAQAAPPAPAASPQNNNGFSFPSIFGR